MNPLIGWSLRGPAFVGPFDLIDGGHAGRAVTEPSLFTSHDGASWKLPAFIINVCLHADDSKEPATKRSRLDRTPDVNALIQERDEDRRRFNQVPPRKIEPSPRTFCDSQEIVGIGQQSEVVYDLLAEIGSDRIVGGTRLLPDPGTGRQSRLVP